MYFIPKLQNLLLSDALTLYLKEGTSDPCIPEVLKNICYPFFNEDLTSKIQSIKERTIAQLQNELVLAYDDFRFAANLDIQLREGSFQKRYLSKLYEAGFSNFEKYTHYYKKHIHPDDPLRKSKIVEFAWRWFEKVTNDFEKGKIHSFPLMSHWLFTRNLTPEISLSSEMSLEGIFPFDEPSHFFPLLKKLAYLGVNEAMENLCFVYEQNQIGMGWQKLDLNLTLEMRIAALQELAKSGSKRSRAILRNAYENHRLGPNDHIFSENEARNQILNFLRENPSESESGDQKEESFALMESFEPHSDVGRIRCAFFTALRKREWGFIREQIIPRLPLTPLRETIKIAMTHLEALESV